MQREVTVLKRSARQGHTQLSTRRRDCRNRAAGDPRNAICSWGGCGASCRVAPEREGCVGEAQEPRIDGLFAQRLTSIKVTCGQAWML